MKYSSILILMIAALWIWLSRAPADSTTQGKIPAPQKGFLAPDFSLPTVDGKTIRLADLQGKPVLVNYWASWCAPCRAEMPALQRLAADFEEQGLVVLGVNAASQDDRANALAFVEQQGLTFPILFDTTGDVQRQYAIQSLPTSFFIDHQGIIREVVIGGPMSEALLRIRIEQLLTSKETP